MPLSQRETKIIDSAGVSRRYEQNFIQLINPVATPKEQNSFKFIGLSALLLERKCDPTICASQACSNVLEAFCSKIIVSDLPLLY